MDISPDAINKAIKDHYPYTWSDETSDAILRDVGAEGLALIKEIRQFSNNQEHWIYGDHTKAYEDMERLLAEEYPFLSAESVSRVATSAAWGWR